MLVNTVTKDFVREVTCESTYELILEKSFINVTTVIMLVFKKAI